MNPLLLSDQRSTDSSIKLDSSQQEVSFSQIAHNLPNEFQEKQNKNQEYSMDKFAPSQKICSLYLECLNITEKLKRQKINVEDIKPLEILIAGMQSSGKSTLLEYLLGIKSILTKKNGMASKCLTIFSVKVTLKKDFKIYMQQDSENPNKQYVFKEDQFKQLKKKYQEMLDALGAENELSEEVIVIEIGGGKYPFVIKDIPGYFVNGETDEKQKKIESILKRELQSNNLLIYAVNLSADMKATEAIQKMINWSNTIIAVTHIDIYYKASHQNFLEELKTLQSKCRATIGCLPLVLNFQDKNYSREEMDQLGKEYDEKQVYMNEKEYEDFLFDHERNEMDIIYQMKQFPEEFKSILGKTNALQTISRIHEQLLAEQLPDQKQLVSQKLEEQQIIFSCIEQQYYQKEEPKTKIRNLSSKEQKEVLKQNFQNTFKINLTELKPKYNDILADLRTQLQNINYMSLLYTRYDIIQYLDEKFKPDFEGLLDQLTIFDELASNQIKYQGKLEPALIQRVKTKLFSNIEEELQKWGLKQNYDCSLLMEDLFKQVNEYFFSKAGKKGKFEEQIQSIFETYSYICDYKTFRHKIDILNQVSIPKEKRHKSMYEIYFRDENNSKQMIKYLNYGFEALQKYGPTQIKIASQFTSYFLPKSKNQDNEDFEHITNNQNSNNLDQEYIHSILKVSEEQKEFLAKYHQKLFSDQSVSQTDERKKIILQINKELFGDVDIMTTMEKDYQKFLIELPQPGTQKYIKLEKQFNEKSSIFVEQALLKYFYFHKNSKYLFDGCYRKVKQLLISFFEDQLVLLVKDVIENLEDQEILQFLNTDEKLYQQFTEQKELVSDLMKLKKNYNRIINELKNKI